MCAMCILWVSSLFLVVMNVRVAFRALCYVAPGKVEEEVGESDEPELTASADLEDSR